MFHVKHRHPEPIIDPNEVGQRAGAIVGELLHESSQALPADFMPRMQVLATNIARWGARMNLTAHPEDPDEIAFHVIDSVMPAILAQQSESPLLGTFDADRNILDLGSGGGFPGLVLAAACGAHFMLVEARRKRTSFLQVASAEMGLTNVTIDGKRAEDIAFGRQFDGVTSRAMGNPDDFFTIARTALKPGGIAMLYGSPAQRTALQNCAIIEYVAPRRGSRVPRILAIYRQPVEQASS